MCGMVGIYSLITAVLICLGYNKLYFELKLPNGSVGQLLDVMDYISNSFLMPFISLLTSILIGLGYLALNGLSAKWNGMASISAVTQPVPIHDPFCSACGNAG